MPRDRARAALDKTSFSINSFFGCWRAGGDLAHQRQKLPVLSLELGELRPGGSALRTGTDPAIDGGLVQAVVFDRLRDGDAFLFDPANDVRPHFRRRTVLFLTHRHEGLG